jgi:hypothetical protein
VVLISGNQIPLDFGVDWRLAVWIFLRFLEYLFGASFAQAIANQDTVLTLEESIQRQRLLAFVFHHADRPLRTGRTQVSIVEPE